MIVILLHSTYIVLSKNLKPFPPRVDMLNIITNLGHCATIKFMIEFRTLSQLPTGMYQIDKYQCSSAENISESCHAQRPNLVTRVVLPVWFWHLLFLALPRSRMWRQWTLSQVASRKPPGSPWQHRTTGRRWWRRSWESWRLQWWIGAIRCTCKNRCVAVTDSGTLFGAGVGNEIQPQDDFCRSKWSGSQYIIVTICTLQIDQN